MKDEEKNRAKSQDTVKEQYKLYLQENGEHGLYISPEDVFEEDSVMYRAYYAAVSALKGILNDMERQKQGERRFHGHDEDSCCHKKSCPGYAEELPYERASNIIAFCGARGQGKTSAMLSFTEALSDDRRREKNDGEFWKEVNGYISHVYAPPPIDLTMLESGETLLEVILSNFLHALEEKLNKRERRRDSSDDDQIEINRLYRSIKDCLNKVRTLSESGRKGEKARNEKVTLDDLYQLASDARLATKLYQLIQRFFCFLCKDPEKSYLLVRLDDTDLQFERAYDILEEARKYLSLPNVIVVMATDLEQLRLCVMKRFHEELKEAFDDEKKKWEYVQEASAKYLDKLIPATHAIYLPTIRSFYDTGKEIILYRKKNPHSEKNEGDEELGELQNYILRTIFEKTGMAFLKRYKSQDSRHRKGHIHHVIPTTLRGLTHLIRLLEKMSAPHEKPQLSKLEGKSQNAWGNAWKKYCKDFIAWAQDTQKNLRKFEDYFLNDWCSSRLRRTDWDMIREIRSDATPDQALRHMVFLLKELAQKEGAPPMDTDGAGDYILLNRLLKQREESAFSRKTYSFCFAVRTYFSILFQKIALQEQIDSLCEELEKPNKGEERPLFSFRYTRLQDFLKPQMFDTQEIQKTLSKNLTALGLEPIDIFWSIDEGMRDELHDQQVKLIIGNAPIINIPVYLFAIGDVSFDTFNQEGAWRIDLLNYFYKGLSFSCPDNFKFQRMSEEQLRLFRMQNLAVFVCCNWDVQEKIQMSLTGFLDDTFALWGKIKQIAGREILLSPLQIREENLALYLDAIYQHIFDYLWERLPKNETSDSAKKIAFENISFIRHYLPHYPPDDESLMQKFTHEPSPAQLDVMGLPISDFGDKDFDIMNMPIFDSNEE